MSQSEQKVVQYLNEAHASELGLVQVLQAQIAMTPRGSYRSALESISTRPAITRVASSVGWPISARVATRSRPRWAGRKTRWRKRSRWPRRRLT